MKIKNITNNGWVYGLANGNPCVEDEVKDIIYTAIDIDDLKNDLIARMLEIMDECSQVIKHTHVMKTPKECTCTGNCSDKT